MKLALSLLLVVALAACGPKRAPTPAYEDPPTALELQKERAAEEDKNQTLELVRLASMALAADERDVAYDALRRAVLEMQDFRADGQFAATVGAEARKEWKGDPYEKMMAFFYLGVLLYQDGQYGNALAMTKSAILADTGSSQERFRADFMPAFVLQALAYEALNEPHNSKRSIEVAIDTLYNRRLIDELTELLLAVTVEGGHTDDAAAATTLLLSGIPAGLTARPRDPEGAAEAALSYATDLRQFALDGSKKSWPGDLSGVSRSALKGSFDYLEPIARKWIDAAAALPPDLLADLEGEERFLRSLLDDPRLVLFVETGRGPRKVATGRYGEVLQIVPGKAGKAPRAKLDGRPLRPQYLDSVTYQAQTRGGRRVDGFLKGKAVFKDSSGVLGYALIVSGDIANVTDNDTAAAVLYTLGVFTWIAGAVTNPTADTRGWEFLPDRLWILRADPPPGTHTLRMGSRTYTVDIPDTGTVLHLLTNLAPYGPSQFGTPCTQCDPALAIPTGDHP